MPWLIENFRSNVVTKGLKVYFFSLSENLPFAQREDSAMDQLPGFLLMDSVGWLELVTDESLRDIPTWLAFKSIKTAADLSYE